MSKTESKRTGHTGGLSKRTNPASAERQSVVGVCLSRPIYEKLQRAHEVLRREDGSRPELQEVVDWALDALLAHPRSTVRTVSEPSSPGSSPSENAPTVRTPATEGETEGEEDAPTVRAPVTRRWHPGTKS